MSGSYTVRASRWARGWELHIADAEGNDIGVTQSKTLATGEREVRDYLALLLDLDDAAMARLRVDIRPELDPALRDAVTNARHEVEIAAQAQETAARRQREVARRLREEGLSGADIAIVLGVSPQRVSQLLGKHGDAKRTAAA